MNNFGNFFCPGIFCEKYFDKGIVIYNCCSYMQVVFLSFYYFDNSCLVDFDLYSCIGRKIYLVLCDFVVCFAYSVVLSEFSNAMSISTIFS